MHMAAALINQNGFKTRKRKLSMNSFYSRINGCMHVFTEQAKYITVV